jgi:GDSL-like Lipase/Acylhydrolase family/PASTA domain
LCTGLAAAAFVSFALAGGVGASGTQQSGLYLALGDSITAGNGASSVPNRWAELYYGYLQSNGSGVTDLVNLGRAGATSTELHNQIGAAVSEINAPSDTKAVTIDIGLLDLHIDGNCPTANASACPIAANLRAILAALNTALAADPGDETLQMMEYYNPAIGTANESEMRQLLLGSDGRVDCSGIGDALGLNDLIHCISIEKGATPIDVLPIFDAAGEAFIAPDHMHPNDAGHLAIAKAFGGAATPTTPPPPPAPIRCRVPRVTGLKLSPASTRIRRAHCSVGHINHVRSGRVGRVIRQSPRAGTVRRRGFPVKLVVGRR